MTSANVTPYVALVTISVAGRDQQHELIGLLAKDVNEWVRFVPGFISANYHASLDGTRVLNYATWVDERAYLDGFRGDPRSGALRGEIVRLSEGGPEMVGYRPVVSVQAPD